MCKKQRIELTGWFVAPGRAVRIKAISFPADGKGAERMGKREREGSPEGGSPLARAWAGVKPSGAGAFGVKPAP